MKNIFASVQARGLEIFPKRSTQDHAGKTGWPRRRIIWVSVLSVLLIALVAGGVYAYRARAQATAAQAATSTLQTAVARRGSLVVSASAAGQSIASKELSVGFDESGTLSELLVKVGDQVTQGQVLARLQTDKTAEDIALALAEARLNVLDAQQALDDLTTNNQLDAAQALKDVEDAQQALADLQNSDLVKAQAAQAVAEAQAAVNTAMSSYNGTRSTADEATIAKARAELTIAAANLKDARARYDDYANKPDTALDKAAETLRYNSVLNAYNTALRYYNAVTGTGSSVDLAQTSADLAAAQAQLEIAKREQERVQDGATPGQLAVAEANLKLAQAKYDTLKNGPDPIQVSQAQAQLESAKAKLAVAQEDQSVLELTSPMDGTVMSIDATVGESVASGSIITLADLSRPLLEVYLDETDIDKAVVGYEADVTFDSLPDQTFTGHIVEVDPSLQTVSNTSAVRTLVQLDSTSYSKPLSLPVGSNASVDVIGGRAENAVLVPVEALREISPGQYAVFVMQNGEPTLHVVQVGLMDYTSAQIISGVNAGDTVTTGLVQTGSNTSSSSTGQ